MVQLVSRHDWQLKAVDGFFAWVLFQYQQSIVVARNKLPHIYSPITAHFLLRLTYKLELNPKEYNFKLKIHKSLKQKFVVDI